MTSWLSETSIRTSLSTPYPRTRTSSRVASAWMTRSPPRICRRSPRRASIAMSRICSERSHAPESVWRSSTSRRRISRTSVSASLAVIPRTRCRSVCPPIRTSPIPATGHTAHRKKHTHTHIHDPRRPLDVFADRWPVAKRRAPHRRDAFRGPPATECGAMGHPAVRRNSRGGHRVRPVSPRPWTSLARRRRDLHPDRTCRRDRRDPGRLDDRSVHPSRRPYLHGAFRAKDAWCPAKGPRSRAAPQQPVARGDGRRPRRADLSVLPPRYGGRGARHRSRRGLKPRSVRPHSRRVRLVAGARQRNSRSVLPCPARRYGDAFGTVRRACRIQSLGDHDRSPAAASRDTVADRSERGSTMNTPELTWLTAAAAVMFATVYVQYKPGARLALRFARALAPRFAHSVPTAQVTSVLALIFSGSSGLILAVVS